VYFISFIHSDIYVTAFTNSMARIIPAIPSNTVNALSYRNYFCASSLFTLKKASLANRPNCPQ